MSRIIGPEGWTHHEEPVAQWPGGYIEDFHITGRLTVGTEVLAASEILAVAAVGKNFQNLRPQIFGGRSLLGPFEPLGEPLREGQHHRIRRAYVEGTCPDGAAAEFVTQLWPGSPKAGIWIFESVDGFRVRRLLIPPRGNFAEVAGNPTAIMLPDGTIHLFFEGRGREVQRWHVFHAHLSEDLLEVEVNPEPLWCGANPSALIYGNKLHLYYSAYLSAGGTHFETRVATHAL